MSRPELEGYVNSQKVAHDVEFRYPETLDHRKVGIENEYPVVFADGSAVPFPLIRGLFEELGNRGWRLVRDEHTDQLVAAVRPREGSAAPDGFQSDIVTIEFGHHTVEVNLAPTDGIVEAERSLNEVLSTLTAVLHDHEAFLIGYGVQPLAPPVSRNVSPRGRYRLLERSWIKHPGNQYDIYLLTLSASCQTHVDVTRTEVVPALNALNLTAGLRVALFANSPVWNGSAGDYAASRELFWDWSYGARKDQIGIPHPFEGIEDYVDCLMGFRGLLTRRGDEFFSLDNRSSYRDYFANRSNSVETAAGVKVDLEPTLEDVEVLWGLAWFDARLQPRYRTVEDRCSCQQPPSAHLASPALTLGLVENLAGLTEIAGSLSADEWREIRLRACRRGMKLEYPGVDVPGLIGRLVEVAHAGLVSRGHGEEKFLEPLYERIQFGSGPATDARRWFSDGGGASLVRHADMTAFC